MDELKKLENTIQELLGEHNCVTVPGLGSFIYRETPASANHFTMEIKPSGNSVFFNNAILADDGILANGVREKEGLTYAESLSLIQQNVELIKTGLAEKRNLGFGGLGNFFLNAQQQVFFLPSGSLNLSKASFGLPVIKLDELQEHTKTLSPEIKTELVVEKTKPVQKPEVEFEEAEVLELEENGRRANRGIIWRVAAGFAIISLSVSGYYFAQQVMKKNNQNKASSASMESPVKQTDIVIATNPEIGTNSESDINVKRTESNNARQNAGEKSKSSPVQTADNKADDHFVYGARKEIRAEIVSTDGWLAQLKSKKGNYYVLGGMFIGEDMAKKECAKWNSVGVNASIFKPENSSLYRIVLGRFDIERDASEFIKTMGGFHGSTVSVRDMDLLK